MLWCWGYAYVYGQLGFVSDDGLQRRNDLSSAMTYSYSGLGGCFSLLKGPRDKGNVMTFQSGQSYRGFDGLS